jgi:capsular polysaccharide biosynthesis protein
MDVRTYMRIIGRYWPIIMLVTALAGSAAIALVNFREPQYNAAARVVARPATIITDTRVIVDLVGQMGDRRVTGTFAEAFTSVDVRTEARASLGMSDEEALRYPLKAVVLPDTHVIEVSGTGPNPVRLATLINATVEATLKRASQLFRVIDLQPLEPARPPQRPSAPVPARDIPLGFGLGLILGVMLAFATDYLRGPRGVGGQLRTISPAPSPLPVRKTGG